MKEESKEEVVIRPVAYIIGLIWTIIATVFTSFIALFTTGGALWGLNSEAWSNSWVGNMSFMWWWPLIVLSIMSAAARSLGLNRREMVIILAMVWVTWIIPSHYGIIPSINMLGTARQIAAFHKWNLDYAKDEMWQWGPDPFDDSLWESWMYGGPVPWSAWMPTLLWQIARIIPYYLFFAFMATLWRRQWLEIEALPFPTATAASRLIDSVYEGEKPRFLSNKFLWLGVLIGFLAIFPYWGWMIPGLGIEEPEHYCSLGYDFTPLVLIPLANLNFNFEAFLIGAAFLVPTKTLLSYIITCIAVYWIWWPTMAYLGLWEPQEAGTVGAGHGIHTTIWRGWTGPRMKAWVNTYGANAWVAFGVGFGLLFYPVLVAFRGELVNVLKAFVGKAPREVEEREPMNYRLMLLGTIVFLLIHVGLWWYGSMGTLPVLFGIIWTVTCSLLFMCRARVAAEYGLLIDALNENQFAHNWDTNFREWWIADPASPFYIKDVKARFMALRPDMPWYATYVRAAPMATLLEAYRIGALQGVPSKYIFGASMLAVIVSVIVGLFTLLSMWCSFGAVNLSIFNFTGAPNNYQQRAPTYTCIEEVGDYWRGGFIARPTANQWILFAIGAILISVIYYLQGRYPWFPLNAGGVMMGFGWVPVNALVPSIVAYIAKTIVLRVGGAELYERKAMPFAVGMAAACGFAVIMGAFFQLQVTLAALK